MEGGRESILDAIFHDHGLAGDDTLDEDDVEMLDAEALDPGGGGRSPASSPRGGAPSSQGGSGGNEPAHSGRSGGRGKRRNRPKNKKKGGGDASSIADLNRFVIETCKNLREHKSYLVWNAVGCLGISALRDLVKEVNAIQRCGGQKTIDGYRFRTGGGILWNILKTREPKAYKEIMTKGKEFEKQFKVAKPKTRSNNEGVLKCSSVPEGRSEGMGHADSRSDTLQDLKSSDSKTQCKSLMDRNRVLAKPSLTSHFTWQSHFFPSGFH